MAEQRTETQAQLLVWLDEQQREHRRQLAEIRKLAATQGREMEDLTKRFEDLERRLNTTQTRLGKVAEIGDALEELKNEVLGVVRESEARLEQTDSQLRSQMETQSSDVAGLAKTLEAIQGSLTTLEQRVEKMPAVLDEQVKQAAGFAQDIEELEKRFNQTQARLAQLGERVANQTDSTAALARQLEGLEGRLTNTQAQLVKFPQIEAALQETKNEIVFMIEEREAQRQKEARELAALRDSERKDVRAALDNIEQRLTSIPQLSEQIKGLMVEDKRLQDLISQQEQAFPPLHEALKRHAERLAYLEEQPPKTSHRIDELEQQTSQFEDVMEEITDDIQFLQEWAQRSAEKIDELTRFEDQMEQWRTSFIEEIRQGEQRRDRRLSDWEHILEQHAEAIERWRETLRRYQLAHQDNRRTVGELQTLAEQMERDQAEVAEQQRLADERLQRELEAWQEENEKRWRLFLKRRDYDWEQEAKRNAQHDQRLELLEAWSTEHTDYVAEQVERLDENDRRVLTRLVALVRRLEQALEREITRRIHDRDELTEEIPEADVLIEQSPSKRRRAGTQPSTEAAAEEG